MPEKSKKLFPTVTVILAVALAAGALLLFRGGEEPGPATESSFHGPAQGAGAPAGNATTAENPEDLSPLRGASRPQEDAVVTLAFVDALTDFLVQRYHPAEGATRSTSSATVKALNQRFGRGLDGLAHQDADEGAARTEILNYALASGMIGKLYGLYADWFMEALVQRAVEAPTDLTLAGGRQERRALTRAEIADLLRLNAPRVETLAGTFRAVATHPELAKDLERYLDSARKAATANDRFQEIVSRETPPEKELRKAGDRLKKAIAAREQIRADILDRLRASCQGRCEEDGDSLYTVQWCARRLAGHPERTDALAAAADVLDDLAARFRAKAAELESAAPSDS
ncbi:hypothetical protein M7784_13460 [Desulfovibrio aminophilus]|nr:hypothetical protein [Desulfovibrio aminophilus]MCM0756242.1 hypothetical protein [Desulfovibrio aminophilus]